MRIFKLKKLLRYIVAWLAFRNISFAECCVGTMSPDDGSDEQLANGKCDNDIQAGAWSTNTDIEVDTSYSDYVCVGVAGWAFYLSDGTFPSSRSDDPDEYAGTGLRPIPDYSGIVSTVKPSDSGDKLTVNYRFNYGSAYNVKFRLQGLMVRRYAQKVVPFFKIEI